MDCVQASEMLTAWVLGELSDDERAELLDHVAPCEHCLAEASDVRGLLSEIGTILVEDTPRIADGFRDKVLAEAKSVARGSRQLPRVRATRATTSTNRRRPVTTVRSLEAVGPRRVFSAGILRYVVVPAIAAAVVTIAAVQFFVGGTGPVDQRVRVQVVEADGGVELITAQGSALPIAGESIVPGAVLQTGIDGHISVRYPDGTVARIAGNSDVTLDSEMITKLLTLSQGRVSVKTSSQSVGGPMVLATPVCEVKAGRSARFVLIAEHGVNRIEVESGRVFLTRNDDGASIEVPGSFYAEVGRGVVMVARASKVAPRSTARREVASSANRAAPRPEDATVPSSPAIDQDGTGELAVVGVSPSPQDLPDRANFEIDRAGEPVAYLDSVDGEVLLVKSGSGAVTAAAVGVPIYWGDGIETQFARARVCCESGTVIHVNRFTQFSFSVDPDEKGLAVGAGEVYVEVSDRDIGFYVDTPHGRTTDLGTKFDVSVKPITGTNVLVAEGLVEATTEQGSVFVKSSHEVRLSSKSSPPGSVRKVFEVAGRIAWSATIPGGSKVASGGGRLADGLVGCWRFDEGYGGVAHSSTNRQLLVTLPGASWSTGCVGPAVLFRRNGYGFVKNSEPLDVIEKDLSLAAWIWIDRPTGDMKIAGRQVLGGGGYKLEVYAGKLGFDIFAADTNVTLVRDVPGGVLLKPRTWYHVAGVCSSADGMIRTYVNGVLDRSTRIAFPVSKASGQFVIGREPYNDSLYWNGKIDELYLYERALNEQEIRHLAAWRGLR